ncbi:MAG: hypothetical protein HPY53_01770 [Brevinematales bacterium]|nr:hypothetical protein [Brevinematales bacterium]
MELDHPIYRNNEDSSAEREPVFSPDGSKCAFRYRDNGIWFVNVGDEVFGGYDWVQTPRFSDDSESFGFIYKKDGLTYLNINGKVFGGYQHFAFRFIETHRVVMVYEHEGDIIIDEL